jgi:23S rRNA (adenine2503-C2)-methyltransferase
MSSAVPFKIFECTQKDLTRELTSRYGKGDYHSRLIYREFFQKGVRNLGDDKTLRLKGNFLSALMGDIRFPGARLAGIQRAGEVTKFQLVLEDGLSIESVIIPMPGYYSLCVSTQVGCRMGCRFCETGRMGFRRNLSVEEIVCQVMTARFELGMNVQNIVFMGMGEPLDNVDAVLKAISIFADQRGFDISCRRMTLSTAGLVSGIRKLIDLKGAKPRLAVSLNAPSDEIRSRLMPLNRSNGMEELRTVLQKYGADPDGCVFVEYVMVRDINDAEAHADQLASYLDGLRVKVNVIALNPLPDAEFRPPPPERVKKFCRRLADHCIWVRLRTSKGDEISAACGQLAARRSNSVELPENMAYQG